MFQENYETLILPSQKIKDEQFQKNPFAFDPRTYPPVFLLYFLPGLVWVVLRHCTCNFPGFLS